MLDAATMQTMVESHIINGAIRDFNKRAFYATKTPFTYVYTDNGVLHGENGAIIEILNSWETTNGPTYQINEMFAKNDVNMSTMLRNNYQEFFTLLKTAGIIGSNNQFVEVSEGERAIIFAPQDGTLDVTTLNALPKEELAQYLRYFIVTLNANVLSDYILPNYDGSNEMKVKTLRTDEELTTPYQKVFSEMDIKFSGNSLKLTNQDGTQSILTNGEIPFFATDGLIYCITDVIQPK